MWPEQSQISSKNTLVEPLKILCKFQVEPFPEAKNPYLSNEPLKRFLYFVILRESLTILRWGTN